LVYRTFYWIKTNGETLTFENIVHLSEIIGLPLQIKQLANSVNFDMLYRLRFLA